MELPTPATIDISIITFNSATHLPGLFESLLQQDYPLSKLSILLTDHGSSDDSWQQVRDFSEAFGNQFHRLVLRKDLNRGFGEGHNRNLEKASSQFVLVCNADVRFEQSAISNALRIAQEAPEDVVAWEFRQVPSEHPKYYHPIHRTTHWNSHACVLLRLTALREVGGYERRFFMYGEDVDLSFRLRSAGYELWYCYDALVFHPPNSSHDYRLFSFIGMLRANFWIRLRHGRWSDVFRFIGVYATSIKWCPKSRGWIWHLISLNSQWLRHVGHFMNTRQSGRVRPTFRALDYSLKRWEGIGIQISRKVSNPLVSIIIRTHGDRGWMAEEAVRSVAAQDYGPIELVVVEDGSNCFQDRLERMDLQGCQVSYYSIAKQGRSFAGNHGLRKAQGELLGFLDDDDLLYPDHVGVLVSTLIDYPGSGAAYSVAFEMATDMEEGGRGYLERGIRVAYRQDFSRALLQRQNYLPIQTVLFRRQLFDRYGGFHSDLDQLEDWNLWARFAWVSQFQFVDRVTSMYRVPYREEHRRERQQKLDKAFEKVRQFNLDFQREDNLR